MEDWTEKEKLCWLAGFFDGDGSMSIQKANVSFAGSVFFGNSCIALLKTVETFLYELGFSTEDVRCYGYPYDGSRSHPSVRLHNTAGARLLKMMLPYIQHPKQQKRAEIFIEAFAGQRGEIAPERKHQAYIKWLELKIKELET
ncbi:hypothetical protein LCGC14_0966010 [marine sediment metagenome]|uniref:Homing endonuclease LAGLIDADG domain-containing protein n=1 Tax=marine sediment metagenome TaxID=412755 RepID=A0A0F9QWB8_9ZZZZ